MSPCRSSVRFPWTTSSLKAKAPGWRSDKKRFLHPFSWRGRWIWPAFPVWVAAMPGEATVWPSWAFLGHCWPRICCGFDRPSHRLMKESPTFVCSTQHIETVALENPLIYVCGDFPLCVCVLISNCWDSYLKDRLFCWAILRVHNEPILNRWI